jgi:hypothetical protein
MAETTSEVRLLQPEKGPPARPALFINGQPYSGLSYMTYIPDGRPIRQFSDVGCPIFFFSCTPDDCMYEIADRAWLGPDEYDYSQFDERIALFAEAAPNAYFIPRVYMTSPPWWDSVHPDELVVFDDGTTEKPPHIRTAKKTSYPSLASETWRKDTIANLQRFIRYVENGPYGDRVAGYHIASQHTEEWFAFWVYQDYLGDYSRPARKAWQRWLRHRYGNDRALRRAWGRDNVSLNDPPMPSGDERRAHYRAEFRRVPEEQPSIDYALFFSDLMVETLELFAKAAKEACDHKKVIGAFYGYLLQFAEHTPVSGHLAVQRAFSSPYLDFFTSPSAYIDRALGTGYSFFMSLPETVHAHGKLWINENDIHTWVYMERNNNFGLQKLHGIHNNWDSLMMLRREVGNSLCHADGMWWFDFWARWYDDDDHMAEVENCLRLGKRLAEKPLESVAQVLLVVDAESIACQGWRTLLGPCLSRLVVQLGHIGSPIDIIEANDPDKVLSNRHRLIIFPNLWAADPHRRVLIRRLLTGSEKTALWLYAPCSVKVSVEHISDAALRAAELTGFHLSRTAEAPRAPELSLVSGGDEGDDIPFVRRWREKLAARPLTSPAIPGEISSEAKMTSLVCTPVKIESADGVVLAETGDGQPGLIARNMEGWTSVWCAAPMLLSPWLQTIAAAAGVHLFIDGDDTIYANSDLLCIAAAPRDGTRTVRLPEPKTVRNPHTGELIAEHSGQFTIDLRAKEVVLLELE